MSIPEEMPRATIGELCSTSMSLPTGPLLAGLCALTRLNFDTWVSLTSGVVRRWESALHAQTPEQFVTRQFGVLPWWVREVSGYADEWMKIARDTTAAIYSADDQPAAEVTPSDDIADGETASAAEVDATQPASADAPAKSRRESAREIARAVLKRAADVAADEDTRQKASPVRRPSSR
jgi:hypothetical protein